MKRPRLSRRVVIQGLVLLFAWCHASHAATLTVARDKSICPNVKYSTIGAALTAAAAGDEIHVCPGLYPEQLIITRPVTLHGTSANGINRVLVQPSAMTNLGSLPFQAVINVVNNENVTIDGRAIDASHNSVPAVCNVTEDVSAPSRRTFFFEASGTPDHDPRFRSVFTTRHLPQNRQRWAEQAGRNPSDGCRLRATCHES